jgi:hypothetical protein
MIGDVKVSLSKLGKRGDEFRRYTWFDVAEDPGSMLRELRRLLGR